MNQGGFSTAGEAKRVVFEYIEMLITPNAYTPLSVIKRLWSTNYNLGDSLVLTMCQGDQGNPLRGCRKYRTSNV